MTVLDIVLIVAVVWVVGIAAPLAFLLGRVVRYRDRQAPTPERLNLPGMKPAPPTPGRTR